MQKCVIALLIVSAVFATRVVIINDIHLDPFYDPSSTQKDCRGPNPFSLLGIEDTDMAPYGRHG
jgi:hypothetical protein